MCGVQTVLFPAHPAVFGPIVNDAPAWSARPFAVPAMSPAPLQLDTLTPPATPGCRSLAAKPQQYRQCWLDDLRGHGPHPALLRRAMRQWCAQTDQLLQQLWQLAGLPDDAALAAVGAMASPTLPLLGRGRAGAAARRWLGPDASRRTFHQPVLGLRPGDRLSGAHGRPVPRGGRQRPDGAHDAARIPPCRRRGAGRRAAGSLPAGPRPAGLHKPNSASCVTGTRNTKTPYSLEPNVKEPWGLRDLRTVAWRAAAINLGRSWGESRLARQAC